MIPYGRQSISQEDINAVLAVLSSDFLTQGDQVPAFEQAMLNYTGAQFAVAVNSATSALHLACLALDLGPDDWLWTTPNTFVASANCGRYCGAEVDFVDIDPTSYNLCCRALTHKLEQAQQQGKLPKVVVAVDFAGQPCDWETLRDLARQYGFYLIEDASHAVGGTYKGQPIGNSSYADITVFSFHPVKIITTAEGGMALTNNAELASRMARLRSHGITRIEAEMTHEPDGPWYYQQLELGLNYRMTELQAALGSSQLQRIDEFVARRRSLAQRYDHALNGLPLQCPQQHPEGESAFHLYPIVLQDTSRRLEVFNKLRAAGIGVNVHYIPVHTQPYYQQRGHRIGDYPIAEAYYAGAISLPLYADLSNEQQEFIIATLKQVLA